MGKKKNKSSSIGRTIIKDRFGHGNRQKGNDTFLHTSELNDGYDWGRLNLQSVTEQSNLEEFLTTAELAGTEFTAEKLNIKFVDPRRVPGLSQEERRQIKAAQDEHRKLLRIPRRPSWDESTTAEQLDLRERDAFLEWRRTLAGLQEVDHIVMTPYEKNLDFWRQLWRVIERSDVVVQIVDARNPLLFRCEDVERYVLEVDPTKVNLLLVNKADYLTYTQRQFWADYFTKQNVRVVFWSALQEANRQKEEAKLKADEELMESSDKQEADSHTDGQTDNSHIDGHTDNSPMETDTHSSQQDKSADSSSTDTSHDQSSEGQSSTVESAHVDICSDKSAELSEGESSPEDSSDGVGIRELCNCAAVVSGVELLEVMRSIHTGRKHKSGVTTVGMIGYPNVGKSSTINAILQMKKVPVSATPGRTKHFQTLFVEPELMLCDCPGLVYPSFVSTKADLVVNGILPIDQMRDHVPPVSIVCERIPRADLETTYSLNIPLPAEETEDLENGRPTAHELLNAYGLMRGYMTSNGLPDCPRSARYILKDYVNGKLLYCHPPPDVDLDLFSPPNQTMQKPACADEEYQLKPKQKPVTSLDKQFFAQTKVSAHTKGVQGVTDYVRSQGVQQVSSGGQRAEVTTKPWKKHGNRHKKEKLRRLHSDLDQH